MTSAEYKAILARPDVFPRGVLTRTIRILQRRGMAEASDLLRFLNSAPISKPPKHTGGPESDVFSVTISSEEASRIVDCMGLLEAESLSEEGDTTPKASEYGTLLDRWNRYCRYRAEGAT